MQLGLRLERFLRKNFKSLPENPANRSISLSYQTESWRKTAQELSCAVPVSPFSISRADLPSFF
jgi:hypothetical protein